MAAVGGFEMVPAPIMVQTIAEARRLNAACRAKTARRRRLRIWVADNGSSFVAKKIQAGGFISARCRACSGRMRARAKRCAARPPSAPKE